MTTDSDPDPEVQELTTSLENASSLEELYTLAGEAKDRLRGDSTVAARNPELVMILAEIYQREEEEYAKEEYDRVYVLRYTAWALSESVKHRPEPVLEIIETPLRLLRDTTVSKNIRNAASSIMETLVSEHPEQLVPLLEEHHTAVSEAMDFRSPDQPSQTAAKAAANLISTYTEYRDTGLFHQHVEALFRIISQDSAYLSLQRIAEEHPTSVLDNALLFVDEMQRHRPEGKSDLKATRAADVLATASQSISTASGQWMADLELREAASPTMRRELVTIYAHIAENTEQSPINSREKLESLVTDDDWQIRKQAVKLVAVAEIDATRQTELLEELRSDPMPEVAKTAAEVQEL